MSGSIYEGLSQVGKLKTECLSEVDIILCYVRAMTQPTPIGDMSHRVVSLSSMIPFGESIVRRAGRTYRCNEDWLQHGDVWMWGIVWARVQDRGSDGMATLESDGGKNQLEGLFVNPNLSDCIPRACLCESRYWYDHVGCECHERQLGMYGFGGIGKSCARTCVVVRNIGRRRGLLDRDAILGSVVVSSRRCDSIDGEFIMCVAS